jgi:hypothetical protein
VSNGPKWTVPDEVTLTATASRDGSGGTVISGTTNLPDGAKLGVELMNGERATAQDFNVFVASGKFHSAGFRRAASPLPAGKQKVHIFTYFTSLWQTPTVLSLVGKGGSKLKTSALIHSEDTQLVDGDNVLDFTSDLVIPTLGSVHPEILTPAASQSAESQAIEIVKKAVLVVDGSRSSMNVEDGAHFYFTAPGNRMGDGWSAMPIADNAYSVFLDFVNSDGKGKEWHERATWEVNLTTRKVLYRNKSAKAFSWIPAN